MKRQRIYGFFFVLLQDALIQMLLHSTQYAIPIFLYDMVKCVKKELKWVAERSMDYEVDRVKPKCRPKRIST